MSNTPNLRHRRAIIVKRFSNSGAGAVNDCKRPSRGASKDDLAEFHRENVALQIARRRQRTASRAVYISSSISTANRHGGKHQHRREIERRERQAVR